MKKYNPLPKQYTTSGVAYPTHICPVAIGEKNGHVIIKQVVYRYNRTIGNKIHIYNIDKRTTKGVYIKG